MPKPCKSEKCGRTVEWLRNDRTGSMAPIDVVPDPAGNVTIDMMAGTYHVLTKLEKAKAANPGLFDGPVWVLYTNHFQTCPDAESFYQKRCRACHYNPCRCAA